MKAVVSRCVRTRTRAASGAATIEQFTYDKLNRVTQASLVKLQGTTPTSIPMLSMSYDEFGNLCSKTPIGAVATNYAYTGPAGCNNHGPTGSTDAVARTTIGGVTTTYGYDSDGNQVSNSGGRTFAYNALNQVVSAIKGAVQTGFQYDPDGNRFLRADSDTSAGTSSSTVYIGNVEIIKTGASRESRRYLGGVAIDYVRTTGVNETRFTFADHLGSLDVVTDSAGALIEATSFDAHGSRRDPNTWEGTAPPPSSTTHGFTGHEHIDSLNFIHMNGRIYDPSLGRMLQADPIANPGSQGLNRYAYVQNNPLTLTDPTGYFSWRGFITGAVLGGVVGGLLDFVPAFQHIFNNQWVQLATSLVASYLTYGAISGAFTASTFGGGTLGAIASGAVSGAGAGFVGAAIQTGSFQMAFRGAVAGAITGGALKGFGGSNWYVRAAAQGIAGGLSADILGGKFSTGFEFAFAGSLIKAGLDAYDAYRLQGGYSSSLATGTGDAEYKPTAEMQTVAADTNDDRSAPMRNSFMAAGCDPLGDVCGIASGVTQTGSAVQSATSYGTPAPDGGWLSGSENGRPLTWANQNIPGMQAFSITH